MVFYIFKQKGNKVDIGKCKHMFEQSIAYINNSKHYRKWIEKQKILGFDLFCLLILPIFKISLVK